MANKLQGRPIPKSLHSAVSEANNSNIFRDLAYFSWQVQLSIRIMPLTVVPLKLCENNQFLRPITSDLTARSALLLDNSKLPSSKICSKVS